MIRTTINGPQIMWQIDTTGNLPPYTGALQWNGSTKKIQVSSGSSWYDIDNTVQYNVTVEFEAIIAWAKKKMEDERRITELADKYPALKDAKEKYDIIYGLVTSDRG